MLYTESHVVLTFHVHSHVSLRTKLRHRLGTIEHVHDIGDSFQIQFYGNVYSFHGFESIVKQDIEGVLQAEEYVVFWFIVKQKYRYFLQLLLPAGGAYFG